MSIKRKNNIKQSPVKILVLTRYTRIGPSSRVRFLNYVDHLKKDGYSFDIKPFFDDEYINYIYSKKRKTILLKTIYYFIRRVYVLTKQYRYDLIWLEGECFPWLPFAFEKIFLWKNFIVDYDDALFHKYDLSSSFLLRLILSKKIPFLMKKARQVIVSNNYLKEMASTTRKEGIHLIPTTVVLNKYYKSSQENYGKNKIVVGWIGTNNTVKYLESMSSTLRLLKKNVDFDLFVVGAKSKILEDIGAKFFEWKEEKEVELISKFDIGIMPLTNSPWERGKSGYKLIQYMASQKPVVASPVGANNAIVDHNKNGFLANSPEEWCLFIKTLIMNEELRKNMGFNGYVKVSHEYDLQLYIEKLKTILH